MRDKARIRRFCDELAALWEGKKPNMRFGQLVVTLNRALDKPRHDIFYLEEEEMMDVLRRFFSKEYQKAVREDNRGEQLTERWQDAIEDLQDNTESDAFDLPLLKTLLRDTWQYFIDTVDDFGIHNTDLPLIGAMYVLINRTTYPDGILTWEYEAYIKILEGLLDALRNPLFPCGYGGNFYDGYIVVQPYIHCDDAFHISKLDSYFAELAKMYYEDTYSDTYDENGKEWEEETDEE